MPHLISFTTTKFDASKETPNPTGWDVSDPDTEDWGWYMTARRSGTSYLIGASGDWVDNTPPSAWIVQIHKQRTLLERVTGKNKMTDSDPLSGEIQALVKHGEGFKNVEVHKSA